MSPAVNFTLEDESPAIESIGLWTLAQITVLGGREPRKVPAAGVTGPGIAAVVGVPSGLGLHPVGGGQAVLRGGQLIDLIRPQSIPFPPLGEEVQPYRLNLRIGRQDGKIEPDPQVAVMFNHMAVTVVPVIEVARGKIVVYRGILGHSLVVVGMG